MQPSQLCSKLILLALSVIITLAPVATGTTITYSPQGRAVLINQVGQAVRDVTVIGVVMCGDGSLANGVVYQRAVTAGYSYIMPELGVALVTQKQASNLKHFLYIVAKEGAIDAALAGAGGILSMTKPIILGFGAAHAFFDKAGPEIERAVPNANALLASILSMNQVTSFADSPCKGGTILALYNKGAKAVSLDLSSPVSTPVVSAAIKDDLAWVYQHRLDVIMRMRKISAQTEAEFFGQEADND